VSEA
jgi:hypothetical protein